MQQQVENMNVLLMINKINGHLSIGPDITLSPFDGFDKIRNLHIGEIRKARDLSNGYKWVDIKNIKIEGKYFIISLCFLNEELEMVMLVMHDREFDPTESFESWSEEDEKIKEQRYKQWVIDQLGHEGQFPWGQVSALYDPKSGSSSIVINYRTTRKEGVVRKGNQR